MDKHGRRCRCSGCKGGGGGGGRNAGDGLLKFSGVVPPTGEDVYVAFLADGFGLSLIAPGYPFPAARTLRRLSVNVSPLTPIPTGANFAVELMRNNAAVTGMSVMYNSGDFGIRSVDPGPVLFAVDDLLDVRLTVNGILSDIVRLSAMIGLG